MNQLRDIILQMATNWKFRNLLLHSEKCCICVRNICFQAILRFFLLAIINISPCHLIGENLGVSCTSYTISRSILLWTELDVRFVFSRVSVDDAINNIKTASGYFAEMVEKKYLLFNDSYTQEVPLGPGSLSTRTIVRKPLIHTTINKIYKYYKMESKQGRISIQVAEKDFNCILDVAITMLYCDTGDFEQELKRLKTLEERIELFKSVSLID